MDQSGLMFTGLHHSIQTPDGGRFDLVDPDPADVNIDHVAHALAQLCRFTGHCTPFYSVAAHSLMVSRIVSPELRLQGLLHDAAEAYLGDVSRPLKNVLDEIAPGVLRELDDRITATIFYRFGVPFPIAEEVHLADRIALATEKRDVLPGADADWQNMPEPLPDVIVPVTSRVTYLRFLDRFKELTT